MAQYTPMMQQYLSIKAEAQDAFLFFRLGDFYELFFEDAVNASRELEITLTGREGGAQGKIPMCGVPYHAAEGYISRLIEKGYKVAICEQVEDPAVAKGVVRREIVRTITPGTVMEGKALGDASNNFIVSLAMHEGSYGIAACDLSTGEMHVTSTQDSYSLLLDELNVYQPAEMIGDGSLLEKVRGESLYGTKPVLYTAWTDSGSQLAEKQWPENTYADMDPSRQRAVGFLLDYLHKTQKRSITHISRLAQYDTAQFMTLDPFTRRNLELTETVRERAKKGSLLWLLDKSVTAMGARLLRRWVDKPLLSKRSIDQRLEAVDVLYNQYILREDLREELKQIYDLERLVGRISFGNANARDLLALKLSLARIPALIELCSSSSSQTLQETVAKTDACRDVLNWIEASITNEPPVSVREGGMIKAGYHERLDQLREASSNGKQWLAELEKRERELTGIRTLKIGFNKVFGYYIEVSRAQSAALQDGRYERKQTLANAERYITPELKEKEALILEAEEKMVDIEYDLFVELRERVAAQTARLQSLASTIATVDVYQSLGTVSAANQYRKPEIGEHYELAIEGGRHPIIESMMDGGRFVANDTRLTKEETRMLLITGPNMAGKSTYMRQAALICIIAQIGCFVPAQSARIPLIDRIFTRIGAADDLLSGQSTFMVEMMDIQVMTAKATNRSLVIIDELGRGTSTGEGMAIAQAVIEHLHNYTGCKTLVSTHFHELAHLEESLEFLSNACMAVQESGETVTFLRKLIPGAASTSYGIYCAKLAGLPESIIDRSYALLQNFDQKSSGIKEIQLSYNESAAGAPSLVAENEAVQLSLFGDPALSKGAVKLSKAEMHAAAISVQQMELLDGLRKADVLNMTPLQAIQYVNELKSKLQQM
ncbi:DNA mismatch repair protein MutS [Paenibacillus swuensis]|uniref:DNA mismatch repair protein MutS n=1 Tax=Paenibacillus swuensis TaxID=1178515 RepID=A0A172TLH5_9BACL|nr:DNA mismatch repair protein MutS [Paenibacillus swuensis]ANE47888.1 DNA mismatch repair protein MutS [Paenibacillus swuensis]